VQARRGRLLGCAQKNLSADRHDASAIKRAYRKAQVLTREYKYSGLLLAAGSRSVTVLPAKSSLRLSTGPSTFESQHHAKHTRTREQCRRTAASSSLRLGEHTSLAPSIGATLPSRTWMALT
jgi:hypothetical protein